VLWLAAYKSEIVKSGVLKCREEPPKLLQGNKFQERSFQIKDHRLLLLKDKKVYVQFIINSYIKAHYRRW